VFASVPMSWEDAQGFWQRGIGVPLDVAPMGYWHNPDGSLRYSDETMEDF
jgi:hypothetical protein